ncbi:helix-turn-helix domain-containing protein [Flavobacterium sp. JP2137]|uniref:helix-turn-helix domain-containing protein n=1 Tax=Flavobacterium sp. JP2137 TaxID=3414510 RepID=UPI003D301725
MSISILPKFITDLKSICLLSLDTLLTQYPEVLNDQRWPCYAILWTGRQEYTHQMGKTPVLIPENHFLFIGPNKQHRFSNQKNKHAYILLFNTVFYARTEIEGFQLENNPLFANNDRFYIAKNFIDKISVFKNAYFRYLHDSEISLANPIKRGIAHNIVERILLNGLEENDAVIQDPSQDISEFKIANAFKKLALEHAVEEKNVGYYSDRLNITKRSLDKATERVFGQTAKVVLIDILIEKSKALLANTDRSIKDICLELGFSQETNFSSFFKNYTGESPTEFRSKYL